MYEKIKISVPERISDLLRRDALDFRICKPDGDPNLNALLNLLVINYYEDFAADEEELRESVRAALSSVPEKYADGALDRVLKAVAAREKSKEEDGRTVALALKPTRASERAVVYIENALLRNESLSSFYRRMFVSYARKTKNEREKIIHKEAFSALSRAMKKEEQVCISLDNGQVYGGASVYAVAAAKDELYNYALIYSDRKSRTVRLSKIRTVSSLTARSEIPAENRERFDRQIKCGAQYPIYNTDDEPITVRLTDKGVGMFEKIYLYRPTPVSVDGKLYTFNCSANQALHYFTRFGEEALILSPRKLGIFMRNYYHYALKAYRGEYRKD